MRVRFLSFDLSNKVIFKGLIRYGEGDVALFPDAEALEYIHERIVEAYNYPIPDEEIRQRYKEFVESKDFKRKVDILLSSYSNSIKRAILEDGTKINFELIPQTPNEWCHYNRQLIEYYTNKFQLYSVQGLITAFEKKRFNAPDTLRLIDSELASIRKTIDNNNPEGIRFWYNATYCGDIPRDEDGYKLLLSSQIKFGIERFLQGKALAEYENFLKSFSKETRKDKIENNRTMPLSGYLLHDNNEKLAEQIKTKFNKERGKSIRLLIETLIEMKLLTIENRGRKSFYYALKKYFNRNIGTYQSIFDYKLNQIVDNEEIESVKTKLDFILTSLEG